MKKITNTWANGLIFLLDRIFLVAAIIFVFYKVIMDTQGSMWGFAWLLLLIPAWVVFKFFEEISTPDYEKSDKYYGRLPESLNSTEDT